MADGGCTFRIFTLVKKRVSRFGELEFEAVVEYVDLVEDFGGFLVNLATGE